MHLEAKDASENAHVARIDRKLGMLDKDVVELNLSLLSMRDF